MSRLRLFARSAPGFTLIELLVVILIIAILVAVSAPSFLGQTQKAKDSAAQQYLTYAYQAATAWAVDHTGTAATAATDADCASTPQGDYGDGGSCTPDSVAAAINAFEPELTATVGTGDCTADVVSTDPKQIIVEEASGGDLTLCNDPEHRVWILEVIDHILQHFPSQPTITGVPLRNTSLPTLSGPAKVGQVESASPGSWTGSPTAFDYHYLSCNSSGAGCSDATGDVDNLTHRQYTADRYDQDGTLRVQVTAYNVHGDSVTATSAPSPVVATAIPGLHCSGGTQLSCSWDPQPGKVFIFLAEGMTSGPVDFSNPEIVYDTLSANGNESDSVTRLDSVTIPFHDGNAALAIMACPDPNPGGHVTAESPGELAGATTVFDCIADARSNTVTISGGAACPNNPQVVGPLYWCGDGAYDETP